MLTQTVSLLDRSYDILIGQNILHNLPRVIRQFNETQKSVILITEENVAKIYLDRIKCLLEDANFILHILVLPAGESTKSFKYFEQVTHFCLQHNVSRNDTIIAFGGGVIGDLTGFCASVIKRGCRFIQIPTTLLSQVDSSVGGKTAINSALGKNLIGTFHQPSAVLIDIDFIKTLSDRVYRSGYAEVIKYGLLGDRDFFIYLSTHNNLFLEKNEAFLIKIIAHSVKMKAEIVERDETEKGERALLNLGHTFGHAYEAETNYSDILHHGEAVAIGMFHAAEFSHTQGHLQYDDVALIKKTLLNAQFTLNIKDFIPNFNPDVIITHMMQDKKVLNKLFTFILLKQIGQAFINKDIDEKTIKNYISNIYF